MKISYLFACAALILASSAAFAQVKPLKPLARDWNYNNLKTTAEQVKNVFNLQAGSTYYKIISLEDPSGENNGLVILVFVGLENPNSEAGYDFVFMLPSDIYPRIDDAKVVGDAIELAVYSYSASNWVPVRIKYDSDTEKLITLK